MEHKDPCKKQACALQSCLQASDYQEWKCQAYIQALYDCCAKCDPDKSVVCSGLKNKPPTPTKAMMFSHGEVVQDMPKLPTILEETPA